MNTLKQTMLSLQVLQHSVDRDLHLYKDTKNQKEYIACVKMVSLSSQPINHEYNQNGHRKLVSSDIGKTTLSYIVLEETLVRGFVKGEYLAFIFGQFSPVLCKNTCCGYLLEAPQRGASNEYP